MISRRCARKRMRRYWATQRRMSSDAMTVLPDPVGATRSSLRRPSAMWRSISATASCWNWWSVITIASEAVGEFRGDDARIRLDRLPDRLLGLGLLGRFLRRLMAAPGVGSRVHGGHVAGRLPFGADLPNERGARLHRLGDLAIGLAGIALQQLGDQVALLLGSKVTTVNVPADDEASGVADPVVTVADRRFEASR